MTTQVDRAIATRKPEHTALAGDELTGDRPGGL